MGPLVDGKYRLEERIGDGAMGAVYRAEHVHLRRTVAVKLLSRPVLDTEAVLRFQREAEALARLDHPAVVSVVDFGIDATERRPYLVMEYVNGVPLDQVIRKDGALPPDRALPILEAIASALDHAHAHGILHRDLKPANVLLATATPGVKVLDFGLARVDARGGSMTESPSEAAAPPLDTPDLTASGALLGTPLYAAPELFRGTAATAASDVYSFGVLAYEVLCGRPPFTGTTPAVMAGHLEAVPPDPASFGVPVRASLVEGMRAILAKDPAERPARASEAAMGLSRAWLGIRQDSWRRRERPRRLALATLFAVATAAAGPWLAGLEPIAALERRTEDARFALRPPRPPDPRVLIVAMDEESLAAARRPLAARADEVSHVVEAMFSAGAEGVALDVVLPAGWSTSASFSELVVGHADRIRLAAMADASGSILGTECVAGLTSAALGPEGVSRLFGLVNVREDADGRVREGRLAYREASGGFRLSWAAAASSLLGETSEHGSSAFLLDRSVEPARFRSLGWAAVPGALGREPQAFRGSLVLIGGDRATAGDDVHRVPSAAGRPRAVSGILLQAMTVQTLLDAIPVRRSGAGSGLALTALLAVMAATATLCSSILRRGLLGFGLAAGAALAAAALSFRWTGVLLPLVVPAVGWLAACALALVLRARLSPYPEERLRE